MEMVFLVIIHQHIVNMIATIKTIVNPMETLLAVAVQMMMEMDLF